jgi:hypothetical protein
MSATLVSLLGTVGVHGIAADETGMVIESFDATTKKQSNFLKNRVGNRIGRADYDHSIEISFKGAITATSPFAQKVSAELTLTNTLSVAHLPSGAGTGKTYIDEIQSTRGREDWQNVSVQAEMLPCFPV